MADALPSYKVLRDSSPSEVVSIFRNALFSAPHEAFSQHLLAGVVQGSILPHTFEIWIGVSKSPVPIKIALTQQGSLKVRRAAIRQFGKCLKSEEWRETWDGLGGVPGLLDLLSGLSVLEVKEFCGTVLCSVKGSGKAEKRQAIFQLLRSLLTGPLLPTEGTTAPHRDPDERPLTKYYERLVRKCPLEVVEDIYLRNVDETSGESKFDLLSTGYMVRNHRDFMERLAIQSIFEPRSGRTPPENAPGLRELLQGGSSGSRTEPKFSTSMRFALDLLKRLASAEHANFPDELFSEGLAEPLLRKCRKKNVQWERILEIVKLTAEYLSRSPKAVAALQEKKRGYSSYRHRPAKRCLLGWTAELWTAHPAEFEQPLQLLIKLSHRKGSGVDSFMFDGISEKARYRLLRLCFISVGWGDLDNDSHVKGMPSEYWKPPIFSWLNIDDAWALCQRLSNLGISASQISPDPEKFMLSLLQRRSNNMEALQLCMEEFEKHKKKAMSSREQSDRASHARQALDLAIASKSLGVYKDAVLWARRFIRDALTIPELHQRNSYEARYLLTGDPGNLESDKHTVTSLRDQVVEANEILWIHLETFLIALREPAFNVTFWTSTFALFQNVIDLRQRVYSQALKETKRFSEEDIYKILWEDTLPLLVKAEKVVLQPGHERLGRNNTGGILGLHSCIQVTDGQASTYQFFDELAKARDQLWQEYRPTILPAVAALPEPYPHGLPIEHLTSCFRIRSSQPEKLTPYIASRARAVLFMDPGRAKTSFPEDEEMRTAIGEFVDSYQEALEIYIPKALPQEEKRKRVEEVWNHAIGPLSGDRMTLAEAYRYWREKGSGNERVEFWPDASTEAPGQPEPLQYDLRVPKVEDPREIVEWNPIPPPVTPIKERKLSLTYIDVAKAISCDNGLRVRSPWKDIHPTVPGVPAHQLCRMVKMSRAEDMEFDVVLALLLLDAKNGAKRRILTTPFPSEEDIRYPSIYLDEQYLARTNMNIESALDDLRRRREVVPPALLIELTRRSLEALKGPSMPTNASIDVERIAFGLINVLTQCDCPNLSVELSITTILSRPDASSWHRQLMSSGLLRRLPRDQAQACMENFATAILDRLQEQEAAKSDIGAAKQEEAAASSQKYVKVTTVKHLAQLLKSTDFIPQGRAISILQRLLHGSPHTDIRAAVMDSLLSMLSATDASMNDRIISALETIVPILGSLDGRYAMTEEAWQHAEHHDALPDLPNHGLTRNMPPLLADLIVDFLGQPRWRNASAQTPWRGPLTHRVILPALDLLTAHTTRWLRLFLRQRQSLLPASAPVLTTSDFPPIPFDPSIYATLLATGPSHLPSTLLTSLHDYHLFSLRAPSPALTQLIGALRATTTTGHQSSSSSSSSSPAKRFLALFAPSGPSALSHMRSPRTILDLHAFLRTRPPAPAAHVVAAGDAGITLPLAQALLLAQFDALLRHAVSGAAAASDLDGGAARLYPALQRWIARFEAPRSPGERRVWREQAGPVVAEVVRRVGAMGGGGAAGVWRGVRPDVLDLRVWLLPWADEVDASEREDACGRFAEAVEGLLGEVVLGETGGLYHRRFERVKREVLGRVKGGRERCAVALALGRGEKGETVLGGLKIELAEELLAGLDWEKEVEEEMKKRLEVLVKGSVSSEDEDVRRIAYELAGKWRVYEWLKP